MYYNLTVGPNHEKLSDKPYYTDFSDDCFDLELIKNILFIDNINLDNIDEYLYYDENKNGYVKINDYKKYKKPSNKFILELHSKYKNKIINEFDNYYNDIKYKYKKVITQINELNKNNNKDNDIYDLIFLYASPIQNEDGTEFEKHINYREEIKQIRKVLKKSNKRFRCIFECANKEIFRNALKKQTKILHISSHGELNIEEEYKDKNKLNYSLALEDKGKIQLIEKDELKEIIEENAEQIKKIELVIVSTCYSQPLGEFFLKYAKNVIYVHALTKIADLTSIKFNEYFYEELIKTGNIEQAFNKAKEKTKLNRILLFKKINNCCCEHMHKKNCELNNVTLDRHIHDQKICECNFEDYNIHLTDCILVKNILKDTLKKERFKYIHYENNLKICCCEYDSTFENYETEGKINNGKKIDNFSNFNKL